MRRFGFNGKILVSAALLDVAPRGTDFSDLVSRLGIGSVGRIALALAATLMQLFPGALRWREISTDAGTSGLP